MTPLAAQVHELLLRRGETAATAESLTAGLVSGALTAIPGASATFRGSVVVYASDLKVSLAGVPDGLLAARGPVDPDVATAMAVGVRTRLASTWGLALTGVAGPQSQDGRPVGTLFVAVAGPDRQVVRRFQLSGDRQQIRAEAVRVGMSLLRDTVAERG